jgi:hypothetical protein
MDTHPLGRRRAERLDDLAALDEPPGRAGRAEQVEELLERDRHLPQPERAVEDRAGHVR